MQKLNMEMKKDKSKSKKQEITTENTEKQIVVKKEKTPRTQRKKISKNSVVKKSGVELCELCGLHVLIWVVYCRLNRIKNSVLSVVKKFGVERGGLCGLVFCKKINW
jgi:hypothetical protein